MMKVLLVSDYFYPFTPGGAEWSVYELAQAFKKKGVEAIIATLNYGAVRRETYKGLCVIRLPFAKKLSGSREVVNPFWQNNPIFWITSAYHLIQVIQKERPEIINIHGKFLIPAAVISGFITKKPVIVTIRDKQTLCPIGKCFFNPKRQKACSFWEYLTSDFPWFCAHYAGKNPIAVFYALIGAIWSRLAGTIIKFFAKNAAVVTTISNSQKMYLEANGFKNVKVIYNTAGFKNPNANVSKKKLVLYVGKLSKGKGVELLLDTARSILEDKKVDFVFAGALQSETIKNKLQEKLLKSHTKLLGGVGYHNLPKVYREASVVVMPSIYPESFGRIALESLTYGTPAVVVNTGALPEIIEDKITGRVAEVSVISLKEAILDVLDNEKIYRENIRKNYTKLEKKFMTSPINKYIRLYKELAK